MYEEILSRVDALVAERLPLVLYVGGNDDASPFAYTIGMAAFALPDIILVAPVDPNNARSIVTSLAKRWINDPSSVVAGDLEGIVSDLPVRVRFVDDRAAFDRFARLALRYNALRQLDAPLPAQLVLPDEYGFFPGQLHYRWRPQPLL